MGVLVPTNCKWLRTIGRYSCACPSLQRTGWARFIFGARRACVLAANFHRHPADYVKCAYEAPPGRSGPPQAWRGSGSRRS
jgi:hypothetical protein